MRYNKKHHKLNPFSAIGRIRLRVLMDKAWIERYMKGSFDVGVWLGFDCTNVRPDTDLTKPSQLIQTYKKNRFWFNQFYE